MAKVVSYYRVHTNVLCDTWNNIFPYICTTKDYSLCMFNTRLSGFDIEVHNSGVHKGKRDI